MLYCDAVSYFPDQLHRVVEVMEEREVRIRAPLEEVQMLLDATAATPHHQHGGTRSPV